MPAVGTFGHRRGERSVVHLVGPPSEVVDAGLERQRHPEAAPRSRRTESTATATPSSVWRGGRKNPVWNASVRLKLRCSLAHGDPSSSIVSRNRATCSGSWAAVPPTGTPMLWTSFRNGRSRMIRGDLVVTASTTARRRHVQPRRLGLDLDDVDQVSVTIQQGFDRRRERDADAQLRRSGRCWSLSRCDGVGGIERELHLPFERHVEPRTAHCQSALQPVRAEVRPKMSIFVRIAFRSNSVLGVSGDRDLRAWQRRGRSTVRFEPRSASLRDRRR